MSKSSKNTAIVRTALSSPMIDLLNVFHGECLDYGCGRGYDCDTLGIDGYDPNWRPDTVLKKYDIITCNYVLNVVDEKEQEEIIEHVKSLLNKGGRAFFTVRRDIKKDYAGKGYPQRLVYLDMESIYFRKNRYEIYFFENA
jgi:2-polyprenyl-3-methyl-5-hydroxy-6-metoxy-1,4-benzoquinol methylase